MKKNKIKLIIICLIISFIAITLRSNNSFLFPFNGWDDFNSFYTIGAGWANGLIPYKDLFEQKGPFLYLIYMFAYLLTPYKFTGIYILEIISLTLVLLVSNKIIKLFIKDNKKNIPILFLYAILLTTSNSFITGGSSEEFNLLFTTITIYYIIKYIKTSKLTNFTYKDLFITGICCGLSLLIKYTTIGLWFIMMAYICLQLMKEKKYLLAIKKGLFFIISMLLPLIIFSIYFYYKDALYDFYNVYFYINIFEYSTKANIITKILSLIKNVTLGIVLNFYIYIILIFTILLSFYNKKVNLTKENKTIITIILLSYCILYFSQEFRAYAFLAFGWIALLTLIKLAENIKTIKKAYLILGIIILLISINYKYMLTPYSKTIQSQIASIINQDESPTIMQYRSIDEGFYTATKTLPTVRFFEQVNMNQYLDNYLVQDRAIMNKEVDYVIIRKYDIERYKIRINTYRKKQQIITNSKYHTPYLEENYELIKVIKSYTGYYDTSNYYLYKLKKEDDIND